MPKPTPVTIPSAEGSLEGRLEIGTDPRGPGLLLCHPHPQYGGSMHDSVLEAVAGALAPRTRACLYFNFRGVGASTGGFDGGRGEVADVEAAAHFLGAECGTSRLWLCGYSFGSAMAWLALRSLAPERVLLVAPPIGRMAYPAIPGLETPVDLVYGDADAFLDVAAIDAWVQTAARHVRLHPIGGADHFFMGYQAELAAVIAALQ
jgi:uncharacterized protein